MQIPALSGHERTRTTLEILALELPLSIQDRSGGFHRFSSPGSAWNRLWERTGNQETLHHGLADPYPSHSGFRIAHGPGSRPLCSYHEHHVPGPGLAGTSHRKTERRHPPDGIQIRRLIWFSICPRCLTFASGTIFTFSVIANSIPCVFLFTSINLILQIKPIKSETGNLAAPRFANLLCRLRSARTSRMFLGRRAPQERCDQLACCSKPGGIIRHPPELTELTPTFYSCKS